MASAIRQISDQPIRVTMDQAFRECLDIVIDGLNAKGEQWTPDAKQDMVSTLFLGAQKQGFLAMWQAPPVVDIAPSRLAAVPPAAPPKPASPAPPNGAGAANAKNNRGSQGASAAPSPIPPASAASSAGSDAERSPIGRRAVLQAIAQIREELPWPTFQFILKDFGVAEPEELQNQIIAQGCYAVLKQALTHYRGIAADPASFEHFEASL